MTSGAESSRAGNVPRDEWLAGGLLFGAVFFLSLAGAIAPTLKQPGVRGLAGLVEPVPFLAELAQRGVRAAVFEGVPVA